MNGLKLTTSFFIILISITALAQEKVAVTASAPTDSIATGEQKPNAKRIRRQLSLVVGLTHDEEFLIPQKEISFGGRGTEFFNINRIEGTDFFRILPKKVGNGIATLNDKVTGQILVEIRFDIRDDSIERTMREIQILLADIEGLEFKLINPPAAGGAPPAPQILVDGYVLLPKDLIRVFQVLSNYTGVVRSLVTLSPIARQKIADFITREVNNPEVKITAFGNFIKLEGQVNNIDERNRIKSIVQLYLPDIVTEKAPTINDNVTIVGRKATGLIDDLIIDLMTIKPAENQEAPPPKLIQIVAHFVKFNDSYTKAFNFKFSPAISAQSGTSAQPQTGFDSTINLLNNLLPKLQWSRFHGYAKVLDTASILIQDKQTGSISRTITVPTATIVNGTTATIPQQQASVTLTTTPTIKAERSGLVELKDLTVSVGSSSKSEQTSSTNVKTTISVRDRQSAAFGGIIKKSSDTNFGAPTDDQAIITFNASKDYARGNSQFVVFVTPIIKSNANTGVEQVKKKFRLRE